MLNTILKILITELIEAVAKAVSDWYKWKQKAKANRDEAKEIVKEKDPQLRATRMRDFLNK